jgi:hypothetical protein
MKHEHWEADHFHAMYCIPRKTTIPNSAHRNPSKVFFNSCSDTTITEAKNIQHSSIFGIYEDVRHFSQHSYNITINSHNGQLTLHTDSHASDSGSVRREGRTILGAKSKLLCSEITLSRKPFGRGHMYIYNFVVGMADIMTSQNIDLSPGTFCICICGT